MVFRFGNRNFKEGREIAYLYDANEAKCWRLHFLAQITHPKQSHFAEKFEILAPDNATAVALS